MTAKLPAPRSVMAASIPLLLLPSTASVRPQRAAYALIGAGAVLLLLVWTLASSHIAMLGDAHSWLLSHAATPPFDLDQCHAINEDGSALMAPAVDAALLWKHNRERVLAEIGRLVDISGNDTVGSGDALWIPGRDVAVGNEGVDFIQESQFMYMTGYTYPDAQVVVRVHDGHSVLVLKRRDWREIAFDGPVPLEEAVRAEFAIDAICFRDELASVMRPWNVSRLFTLAGSLAELPQNITASVRVDNSTLETALGTVRRQKSPAEMQFIEYATRVAAQAHRELIRRVSNASSEMSLLALFRHLTSLCGCRVQAYSPIFGARDHAAVLHYQAMNETASSIAITPGQVVLADASGSYRGYASDITRTFPLARFTPDMETIYQIVLDANMLGISLVRPGVKWRSIAEQVRRLMIYRLHEERLVRGNVSALLDSKVDAVFMPHGLGHTVGVDVHDVQPRSADDFVLQPADVVTIEPGVYFNQPLFDAARLDPAVNTTIAWERVDQLLAARAGGVRIEDVVLVTETGHRVLSTEAPKQLDELYALLPATPRRLTMH